LKELKKEVDNNMLKNLISWRKKDPNPVMPFHAEGSSDVDRLLNTLLFSPYDRLHKGRLLPSINIINGEKKLTVEAELPGVRTKDIDISLNGRRLFIKAERKDEKKEDHRDFHRMEISCGSYARQIELPADVDQSSVNARYKNGVLKIELRKTKASQTKVIKIK